MKTKLHLLLGSFIIVAIGLISLNQTLFAQSDEEDYLPVKAINIDIGTGANGLSAGIGFRYSFASLTVGLAGFATDIPNYSTQPPVGLIFTPNQPLPSGYSEKTYSGIIVTFDAGFHLDYFYPYTFFANVGFFTQQDSVLAEEVSSGQKYSYKVENSSGMTFGGGANYQVSDYIALGLGVHNKRGVYGQFIYTW